MLARTRTTNLSAAVALLVLVTSLLATSSLVPAARALTWSAPIQVPTQPGFSILPSITQDSLGRIWLVWQFQDTTQPTVPPPDIHYKLFSFFGGWGPDQILTNDPSTDAQPYILRLQNDSLMVVWASNRGGNFDLFYKINTRDVWSPDTPLTNDPAPDTKPTAVQDSAGRIWVVWERLVNNQKDLYYKVFNGSYWGPDQQLTRDPNFDSSPSISRTKDGHLWLVWISTRTKTANVWYKVYNGTVWTADTQLTSSNSAESNPTIMQDRDGIIWVFWSREINVPPPVNIEGDLFLKTSSDNGATFSSDQIFTNTPGFQDFSPTAAQMSDKRIWIFWASDMPAMTDFNLFYENSSPILTHDVAVTALSASNSTLPYLYRLSINVTITDLGDYAETVTFSIFLNNTLLITKTDSILDGQAKTYVNLTWTYSSFIQGRYLLNAFVNPVPLETLGNQGDNKLTDGKVALLPPGDVNRDGMVTITDAALLAAAWKSTPGSPNWNPNADINRDGIVSISDAAILAAFWKTKI